MNEVTRREFLQKLAALGLGTGALAAGTSCGSSDPTPTPGARPTMGPTARPTEPAATGIPAPGAPTSAAATSAPVLRATPPPAAGDAYLTAARGESPKAMVEAALKALGGIERFVKAGDEVIIKPNICVAYHSYEYAATTNPEVVATLVALCRGAGAKRVRVMDYPFGGTAEQAYAKSGIAEAVKAAGGQMEVMSNLKYQDTPIPKGRDITRWKVYRDVLEANVLIDVPIAKHHNLSRLTLGMKNLLGVVQDRGQLHTNIGQRVADLTSLVRPTLTVVDAVRLLMRNGPTGGSLSDVKMANTIIASHDIVAADAYAATLFGLSGSDIPYISAGAQMGLGTMDLKGVKVEEIRV